MTTVTNAVFRWHGSKWRMYPHIRPFLTRHTTYVEPYGGSAAVLMQKPPVGIEVFNDLDADVYNFFRTLKEQRDAFFDLLSATPYSRQLFDEIDEALRCGHKPADPLERSLWFFVTCEQGWGGKKHNGRRSWRRQKQAGPNFPNRALTWANAAQRLNPVADRLRSVFIENRSALEVIADYDTPNTLFYVDPPYPLSTRRRPDHGYDHEMPDDKQHIDLLDLLLSVDGKVIVSGMAHPIYDDRLSGWERVVLKTRTASHDYISEEVLWISPSASAQMAMRLFEKESKDE